MFQARNGVAESIEALIGAHRELRMRLEDNERILNRALVELAEGTRVAHAMRAVPSIEARAASEAAVQALYAARHRVREAVIGAALQEGMSITEVAAEYGVAPDVVVGFANEAVRTE